MMKETQRYATVNSIAELERALQDLRANKSPGWFQRLQRDRLQKKLASVRQKLDSIQGSPEGPRKANSVAGIERIEINPDGNFEDGGLTDPKLYFVYSRIEDGTTIDSLCRSTGLDSEETSQIIVELSKHGLVNVE